MPSRAHLRNHFSTLAVMIASLAMLSCGGDTTTTPPDPPGGGGGTTLTIALTQPGALPSERIGITGIPPAQDLTGVYATVTDPSGGGESVTYVGRDESGNPFLIAPLFPDSTAIAGGGDVEVSLAGNDVTSNKVPLEIQPLPAATVTVQEQVTNLQDLLTSWLALHGTSRSELRAMDPAAVPIDIFFLWVAQEILDNPSNENSLRAMVDGPVPVLGNETLDFDLANRLLSLTDGDGFFGEEIAGVDSLVTGNGPLPSSRAPRGSVSGSSAAQGCIDPGTYNISDAASLENAMMAGRFAINRLDGASGEYLSDLGSFVGAMGMIPQLSGLAAAVGGALYVYELINKAAGAVLPTSFNNSATDFDIEDKTQFYEDDPGGTWGNFKVTAVSEGWQLDGEILSAIGQIAGFSDLGGFETITEGMSQLAEILTNYAIGSTVAAAINAATQGESFVQTCPGVWPDIGLDETYAEASIPVGNSIEFTSSTFFETRRPGHSEIRVITKSGRFGGAPPALKQKPVEVLTIDVVVDPASVEAEPEETISFTATVNNANDDRVEWTVPAGLEEITRGPTTITVKTPRDPWAPPFALLARSQANTGSREGKVNSDPREGGAVISSKGKKVVVSPRSDCISNGETLQFTAEVTGVENPVVTWSVEGYGHIDENTGLYTAVPAGTTDDIIIATVVGVDPPLQGYANVRVGACVCSFGITVGGASGWSTGGSEIAYQVIEFSPTEGIIQFYIEIPDLPGGIPDNHIFSASIASLEGRHIPGPGSTGDWRMSAVYSDGSQGWAVTPTDSMAAMWVSIDEMTSTFMRGTMSGECVQRNDPKDPELITSRVFITVPFKAGHWDGRGWPCSAEEEAGPGARSDRQPIVNRSLD